MKPMPRNHRAATFALVVLYVRRRLYVQGRWEDQSSSSSALDFFGSASYSRAVSSLVAHNSLKVSSSSSGISSRFSISLGAMMSFFQ